jgi:2-oxoglutarate/2-oxoacid ferredoxin oxidoreductase subunit alpha
MVRELLEGNKAIAEAAVRVGLEAYFGYPITPQNEILEWLSCRLPEVGRVFVQAESELSAISMVYGAACTGARAMTSSSSPGISLMMEGLSYVAGTEVPMVLVNVMRGGPGLGNIAPSQGDYNQICKGGGHGDYHIIVLAPASIQETVDLVPVAFDLAEKYRTIACILIDGSIGQMMEAVELPGMREFKRTPFRWAVTGANGRERNILTSFYIEPLDEEKVNLRLLERWKKIQTNEIRYKEYFLDDAEIIVIGFGTAGRVALSAVRAAREQGIKAGLFRPVTVSPYPYGRVAELSSKAKSVLVIEMNSGQMLDDVCLAVNGRIPIEFYGRVGGVIPFPDDILGKIQQVAEGHFEMDASSGSRLDARWAAVTRH